MEQRDRKMDRRKEGKKDGQWGKQKQEDYLNKRKRFQN